MFAAIFEWRYLGLLNRYGFNDRPGDATLRMNGTERACSVNPILWNRIGVYVYFLKNVRLPIHMRSQINNQFLKKKTHSCLVLKTKFCFLIKSKYSLFNVQFLCTLVF